MKMLYYKILMLVFMAGAISACSNKKIENNIKSLERRIAVLEGKSTGSSTTPVAPATKPVAVANTANDTDIPVMTFNTTEYNFGSVTEGDIVDYTFEFTNTGASTLIINKATATCGCTVPSWPKEPIAVGGKGQITIKFNSANRKNLQTKYVNINANTMPEVTRLKITGNVIPKDNTNS